ncbi:MAG: D-tyrosyl-tRNA(Tyr) deacylase [Anaerolineales bacterium]|nr:D-tyrosyl-tRNA(Tyr) deacylase [Anaerolineales bacterium]
MRVLLQRVKRGRVSVAGETTAEIGRGLVLLVGVGPQDTLEEADWLARKVAGLRIFEDEDGKMNRSVLETGGEAIVVSQFTLYADTQRGRRPSFVKAAPPDTAEPIVAYFADQLHKMGIPVGTGVFGAHMMVEIDNDGPVTILLEREMNQAS